MEDIMNQEAEENVTFDVEDSESVEVATEEKPEQLSGSSDFADSDGASDDDRSGGGTGDDYDDGPSDGDDGDDVGGGSGGYSPGERTPESRGGYYSG